jgi:hypothetical protein
LVNLNNLNTKKPKLAEQNVINKANNIIKKLLTIDNCSNNTPPILKDPKFQVI